MAETRKEIILKTFRVDHSCDECGEGKYRTKDYGNGLGVALMTHPPQYPHFCTNCGHQKNFLRSYPTTVCEEVEVE